MKSNNTLQKKIFTPPKLLQHHHLAPANLEMQVVSPQSRDQLAPANLEMQVVPRTVEDHLTPMNLEMQVGKVVVSPQSLHRTGEARTNQINFLGGY